VVLMAGGQRRAERLRQHRRRLAAPRSA
jgi:hypothetical protein